jgi:hypothetical protein
VDYPIGTTCVSLDVQLVDDNGLPLTGKLAANFPPLTITGGKRAADLTFPALSDLPLITSAFSPGGVKEREGGWYRLDAPDTLCALPGQIRVIGEGSNIHLLCDPMQVGPPGAGTVVVNHNTGGTDAMRVLTTRGNPASGVTIRAYLLAAYNAGHRVVVGKSATGVDGRWLEDMYLASGQYVINFTAPFLVFNNLTITV